MHLADRGYFLIALSAVLAISGAWADDSSLRWVWCWPAGILSAGLALEAWLDPRISIQAELQLHEKLLLGRGAQGVLCLQHNLQRLVTVRYARTLPHAFAGDQDVFEVAVPPRDIASEPWSLRPVRLGPGEFVPLPARVLGRLRLAWWSRPLALTTAFNIAPDSLHGARQRAGGDVRGDTPYKMPGHGGELFQLRSYIPGDPLARIDWKASARARALISREMSEDQHLEIVLIVDAGRMSSMRAGALDRLGVYANITARFAEHAIKLDDRIGLVAYADRILALSPPGRGVVGVRRIREALEQLMTERAESQPMVAARAVIRMARSRSLVIWLTDLDEPSGTTELQTAVRQLALRHVVVCAGLDNATLHALRARPARNWRDPYIALAAGAEAERIRGLETFLRGAGALVVSASAERLEYAVIHAYQSQRRRRRI
ncbi:MAG: DUF58 domain-containing protein [Pseudomonadales bacterium]|nr:DUF58 domain-containing protein [Pseudomonadales bacterium]